MPTLIELDNEFTAFSQQTLDSLALHSVRIDASQDDADNAQVSANTALTRILQTGLDGTLYTDEKVELLRLALTNSINSITVNLNSLIANEVSSQVDLYEPTFEAAFTDTVNNLLADLTQFGVERDAINVTNDQLYNVEIPNLTNLISSLSSANSSTQSELDVALAGLGHATVAGGLDAVVAEAVRIAQPLSYALMRTPVGLWTTTPDAALLSTKTPPVPGDFYEDDAVYGEAYEFPAGDKKIGPMLGLIFDPDRVYRVMLRFRVTSNGTMGGVSLGFGATAWQPGTTYELAPTTYTAGVGEQQAYIYMTGSADFLTRLTGKTVLDLTGATSAIKIFPFVRQNVAGATDGTLRLGVLEIVDVTEAFEARAAVFDEIDSTAPDLPTGVNVTSEDVDGIRYKISATWNIPAAEGVVGYDVAVSQNGGNEVVFGVATNRWSAEAAPGASYTVRVRAHDRFQNASNYTTSVGHTVTGEAIIQEGNLGAITAGKVTISGETTLSDWRRGGDTTKIDGGAVSANTIATNKLTVGNRNLSVTDLQFEFNSPGANQVSWTAGTISYIDNAGTAVTQSIAAGSATWTAGTQYVYWDQGGSTLVSTTTLATAYGSDRVILATYKGGSQLQANYGRTVIDGATIKTGSVTADRMNVTSLSAISAVLGTFASAVTGERVVISDAKIEVYDETDTLRVVIGDLT